MAYFETLLDHCLRRCSDCLITDAGANFTAKDVEKVTNAMGAILKLLPTEAYNRVGKVERSHANHRMIYGKLKIDLP